MRRSDHDRVLSLVARCAPGSCASRELRDRAKETARMPCKTGIGFKFEPGCSSRASCAIA
jgi:hypothetical protein